MKKLRVTANQLKRATKEAKSLGLLTNSIEKGRGNLVGFIGEVVVEDYFGLKRRNTYDYDLVDSDGTTIDVKTKKTSVEPKPYYANSIAATSKHQKCDVYCFVRVSDDYKTAWILGFKDKSDYFEQASFLTKGKQEGDNKFKVKADCYNLPICALESRYGL